MDPAEFALTGEQRRRLSLVAKHGADQIGQAMSRWLRDTVTVNMRPVEMVHFSDVTSRFGMKEETTAAVCIHLAAGLSGTLLFLFDEPSALEIVRRVLQRDSAPTDWDDLAKSVMEETGNIVGTAFLNGLAMALDLEVHPESPLFMVDYTEAILDPLMIGVAMSGEYALLFEADISSVSDSVSGKFTLLPDGECFKQLVGNV